MGTTAGAVGLVGLGLLGQDTRSTAYKPSCSYWTMNRVYCDTPASFARYSSSIRQGLSGAVADVIAPRQVEGVASCSTMLEPRAHTTPRLDKANEPKLSFLQRLLRSLWRLIQLFFRFGPCLATSPILFLGIGKCNNWWWQWLVHCIERSGPAFIKLGQWAATRRDLFNDTIISYLSQLHTQVRPHSYRDTLLQLDESYGPEWRTWLEIDPSVIGSGCIAQVHRGTLLHNGHHDVAVKVSHPGCQDIINIDLGILKALGHVADHLPFLRHLGVSDMVEQFSDFLLSQTDLRLEAANIQRFNDNFKDYTGSIRFPTVYSDLTTKTVLIESFESGVPIGSLLSTNGQVVNDDDVIIDRMRVSKREICKMGVKAFLHMLFIDNFIHGDLHPGNILVQVPTMTDPSDTSANSHAAAAGTVRLVFLDCGLANELSNRDLTNFVDLMHAIMIGESTEVGRLMIDRSRSPPNTVYKPDEFIKG
ncbi:conserved hypothetical protein, partial [Perkinsus marinus ATCC 50983]